MTGQIQIAKMKINTQYIIVLVALFLSLNNFGQEKKLGPLVASTSFDKEMFNNVQDELTVISIINPEDNMELMKLDKLAAKYQSKRVRFIAITDEVSESITNALKYQLKHYQYLSSEENEKVFNKYQTGNFKIFPMQIIMNSSGQVYYLKKGHTKNIEEKLAKRINKLIVNMPDGDLIYTVK